MPTPNPKESKEEYMKRAIPIIMKEKSDMESEQAVAIASSMYDEYHKKSKGKETSACSKIKEEIIGDEKIQYFYGASTLPDRVRETLSDGTVIKGEILDKNVLDKMAAMINDESRIGGNVGSYRTIGLFHDRVHHNDLSLEEAGFVLPGTAVVELLKDYPGNYGLKVGTKVNAFYKPSEIYPDYTPEKINYKIDNGAIGLSIEYNNDKNQERLVKTSEGTYRYVFDTDDFRGFSYARANLIGNPTAVSIKEIKDLINEECKNKENEENGGNKMIEEQEAKLKEADSKIKELETKQAELLSKQKEEMVAFETKMKETIEKAFLGLQMDKPLNNPGEKIDTKMKEIKQAFEDSVKTSKWSEFVDVCDTRIKEQHEHFNKILKTSGIDLEDTSLKVKCVGRKFVIDSVKTKDVIDSSSMNEATYYQTNAMFADKYVPGIVETFMKSDNLLTAMVKEQHIGGNDKYQWRIWTTFGTFTGDNTKAVDPDITSVTTTSQTFLKLETPIREYREAVEVSDFTVYHSQAAVGDLLMQEANRSAEVVVNSLNADLFKGKCDSTSGWLGVNGLLAIADYSTYTTLYGRTRSSYATLYNASSYDTTGEAISIGLIREGYAIVNSAGTNIADMSIVMHPHQYIRLLNTFDNTAATYSATTIHPITMGPAPAEFGFRRNMIPHIDGIPIILDERCVDASGAADSCAVVDMSKDGFVLVTSKPIGLRGLAKVGTTEKVYVSWYGTAVYKRPKNLWFHDDLTLLGA